jgi:hypothetical protein
MFAMVRCCAVLVLLIGLLGTPSAVAALERGDEPQTAIPVSVGTAQYNSSAMTESGMDPTMCGEFEDFTNTMWFSYAPTRGTPVVIDVNSFVSPDGSTDFLAILFVFARHGGSLDLISCNAYPATATFSAQAGTTYLLMVGGLGADDTGEPELSDRGGTFGLTVTSVRGRVLTDRFRATESFVDEGLSNECGFSVTVSFDDRGISKTFFSKSGVRMFTFFIVGSTTFSTDEGRSLTFTYAQSFRDRLDGKVTIVGLPIKVWLDGKVLTLDAGRLVLGQDGSVVFEAGRHPVFFKGIDICGLLAA